MARSGSSKGRPRGQEAAEAVRGAVERTVQASVGQAQLTRERAQELVDELAGAAGRVRTALDDMRVATGDDVRELADRLDALESRIAKLERPARTRAPKATKKGAARKGA
jgi:polyhydroxyalkanoate synthesis regulator phasin